MKKSATTFWIVTLVVLSAIALALLSTNRRSPKPAATSSSQPLKPFEQPPTEMSAAPSLPPAERAAEPQPARRVEAERALAISRIAEPPPASPPSSALRIEQISGTMVLYDASGKALLGSPEKPVFAAVVSPSGKLAVIDRGNGVNELYRLQPFELIRQLPLMPDVPRASAFGPWGWLDEITLIAAVDITRPAAELMNLTRAERESAVNWRERTLLYAFNLADGTLTNSDTARAGLPPSFTVVEMRTGGFVKVEWDEQGTARTAWLAARNR